MKCAVAVRRPKPEKPALQVPLDPEAAALYLAEIMPPAARRELGRLLTIAI
jgi:hypothetical protein